MFVHIRAWLKGEAVNDVNWCVIMKYAWESHYSSDSPTFGSHTPSSWCSLASSCGSAVLRCGSYFAAGRHEWTPAALRSVCAFLPSFGSRSVEDLWFDLQGKEVLPANKETKDCMSLFIFHVIPMLIFNNLIPLWIVVVENATSTFQHKMAQEDHSRDQTACDSYTCKPSTLSTSIICETNSQAKR